MEKLLTVVITASDEAPAYLEALGAEVWAGLSVAPYRAEVLVIQDRNKAPDATADACKALVAKYGPLGRYLARPFDGHFASYKNLAYDYAEGAYVLFLDADEVPPAQLLPNLATLVQLNPSIDLFRFPRINTVAGLTLDHVTRWGWRISTDPAVTASGVVSQGYLDLIKTTQDVPEYTVRKDGIYLDKFLAPLVNWPDYQGRLVRNESWLRWLGTVHETIQSCDPSRSCKSVSLPPKVEAAIRHYKDIDRQVRQNDHYKTLGG